MNGMNGFTKQSDWMKIRATINKHLQNAAEELGITIPNIKNISFSADTFRTKIECFAKVNTAPVVNCETTSSAIPNATPATGPTIEEMQWDSMIPYLSRYGLKAEDYGKKFITANGEGFILCAIKPANHKLPIIGRRHDGKRFKFSVNVLNTLVGKCVS